MKCKTCGKEQHYCTSCGYEVYVDDGYCNQECYLKSEEAQIYSKKLNDFYNSLTKDQKENKEYKGITSRFLGRV